jgi:DNA-binding beta-propeller fold protein YncE
VTLGYITGLAVDSRGTLYVADWFGSRIVEFNQKGAVVRQFTTVIGTNTTTSPGTIGIALDPTETTLWVADSGYHVFTAYTLTGRLVANYGNYESSTAGVMPGFFNYPYGVALDSSGYVYVSDLTINDIQEFDQSGNFQALEGNYGTGPGLFTGPTGVAVDRHGNVLVCDNGGSRIEVFTPPF